jgi:transposase InsO family protein
MVEIVPLIDCGDRAVLAIEITRSQEAPAVLRPLEDALAAIFGDRHGVPYGLELRSDHGPQYTGADAEALCRRWGLVHTFAPVARPTGNAVAERVIQTLKVGLPRTVRGLIDHAGFSQPELSTSEGNRTALRGSDRRSAGRAAPWGSASL